MHPIPFGPEQPSKALDLSDIWIHVSTTKANNFAIGTQQDVVTERRLGTCVYIHRDYGLVTSSDGVLVKAFGAHSSQLSSRSQL